MNEGYFANQEIPNSSEVKRGENSDARTAELEAARKRVLENHKYQSLSEFNKEGVAIAYDGTDYTFIDSDGFHVRDRFGPGIYDWIEKADEDLFWASRDGRKYLIDSYGEDISRVYFDHYENFHNGWARVSLEDDGSPTYINREGKPISSERFEILGPLVDGIARVRLRRNGEWYTIDTNGKLTR